MLSLLQIRRQGDNDTGLVTSLATFVKETKTVLERHRRSLETARANAEALIERQKAIDEEAEQREKDEAAAMAKKAEEAAERAQKAAMLKHAELKRLEATVAEQYQAR